MGPYGVWLRSTSAWQCGGECYTLAVNVEMGPVFHSHSSQMPLYSVPPPFIPLSRLPLFPPPINDPFVRVFLPRWAGRPPQGQDQRTLPKPLHSPRLVSLPPTFLIFVFPCRRLCIFPLDCTHSSQSLSSSDISTDGFLKFLPSLLFTTHAIVQHCFSPEKKKKNSLVSRPFVLPPFSLCVFHATTTAEAFGNRFFASHREVSFLF